MGAKLGKLETKGDFLYLLDKQNEVVSKLEFEKIAERTQKHSTVHKILVNSK